MATHTTRPTPSQPLGLAPACAALPRADGAFSRRRHPAAPLTPALALLAWAAALSCQAADENLVLTAQAGGAGATAGAAVTSAQATSQALAPVVVTGRAPRAAGVGGFGNEPALATPQAVNTIEASTLADDGVRNLQQITRYDASVSDAYNAQGYWTFLAVRGFVIDNQSNYRRDGLPINAETVIGLENKQRIDILKGTSGIQAGTSAPGGLVDLVVKRPEVNLTQASLGLSERGGRSLAVDVSRRFGADEAFGVRVNAAQEELRPKVRQADGERHLEAVAADWRVGRGTLVELEFENSHQSQPSVPGFSMLGNRVPDAQAIDPRINLNNQPWSQPVVLDGQTWSLRLTQTFSDAWQLVAQAMSQQLKSDDRIAFPFGRFQTDSNGNFVFDAQGNMVCTDCDRYAADGSLTLWDFRSDGERRRTDVLDLHLQGQGNVAGMAHQLTVGVQQSRLRARFGAEAFNPVGTGNIDGTLITPANPSTFDGNTNRDERNTEFYLRDKLSLGARTQVWAGLRHTRLARAAALTDGQDATSYRQQVTTPWLALSHEIAPRQMVYASWGQGIETEVAPPRPTIYSNAGQALPAIRTRQAEAGLKGAAGNTSWGLTAFVIHKPQTADVADGTQLRRAIDGTQRHRGLELQGESRLGGWTLDGSLTALQARHLGGSDASTAGQRPVNVPALSARLSSQWALGLWPGARAGGDVVHEGSRMVTADNSASIPAWTRLDLNARLLQSLDGGGKLVWRAGVFNATDARAWRESPTQFGHIYLFPLQRRSLQLSAEIDL